MTTKGNTPTALEFPRTDSVYGAPAPRDFSALMPPGYALYGGKDVQEVECYYWRRPGGGTSWHNSRSRAAASAWTHYEGLRNAVLEEFLTGGINSEEYLHYTRQLRGEEA